MLYAWLLFKTKLVSSVLKLKLPVPHNNNNDGIKQFLILEKLA